MGFGAVMYAGDDAQERFPLAAMQVTGLNPWDVGIGFPSLVEPYGMTVPMWFCSVRPQEFQWADQWFRENGGEGHGIQTVEDLKLIIVVGLGIFPLFFIVGGCRERRAEADSFPCRKAQAATARICMKTDGR